MEPKDIQFYNDGTVHINSIGRGKKHNRNWGVFADDVELIFDMVKIITSNKQKFLLTKKQIFAKGAYHYRRALAAQREYFALIDDFENNPKHKEKCKALIFYEFERCERTCNENLDCAYYTRQMAEKIGKPTSYD